MSRGRREAEVAVVRTPQARSSQAAVAGASERRLPGALELPIEQVAPDPEQPRRDWSHADGVRRLRELTESVRVFGVLQPLLVREHGTLRDGRQRYIIIAGARRRSAAEAAGLAMVPVVVRGEEQARVRVLQLVENLQRQELSPLDEARAYQELIDLEGLTPPALAARLHVSPQHVRDRLRVLGDQVLADAVERRQIPPSVAREVQKLPDDEMERLRSRVAGGERLGLAAVEEARERLAAAGIVNPRRKVARPLAAPRPGTGDRVPPETGVPGGTEQTPFVQYSGDNSPEDTAPAARAREQTSFVRGTSDRPTEGTLPHPVPLERTPAVPTQTGGDPVHAADRLAAVLLESLSTEARDEVATLLVGTDPERVWALACRRLRSLFDAP